jgi:solute carrier family 34 (sodium-dependent phosphate cotransporter)
VSQPAPDNPAAFAPRAQAWRVERVLRLVWLVVLLYVFMVGIDLLGSGIAGLGRDFTDQLFRGVEHPLAALCVGILATVLVQSSSITTSTIVALVGAGVLSVGDAVPMVMGANIGTTVTNTVASIGSIRRIEEFRRAFAGATMHDFFNIFSVALLLPLHLATGFLSWLAVETSDLVGDAAAGEFRSPVKAVVGFGADLVKDVVAWAATSPRAAAVGLIVIGLGALFGTLFAIIRNMRVVMAGPAERSLNTVLGRSGSLAILIGVLLTVAVWTSSISTSLLIPMIAAGVLRLENAYPVTLGANIGTTVTALVAALAIPQIEGLQIALVHLYFNVVGVTVFYFIRPLRRLPLASARWIADITVRRRSTMLFYLALLFYVVPLAVILVFR